MITVSITVRLLEMKKHFEVFKAYTRGDWLENETGVYNIEETPPYVLILLLDFIDNGQMLWEISRGPGEGLKYVYDTEQVHGQGHFVVPDGTDLITRDTILVIDRLVQMFKRICWRDWFYETR